MAFSVPDTFQFDVIQDDIDNSEVTLLGLANNQYVNSIAKALHRLNDSHQLPGQTGDTSPQSGVLYASTEVRTGNPTVSICDVSVFGTVYSADNPTSLKMALENIAAIKPSSPFTVTLIKA